MAFMCRVALRMVRQGELNRRNSAVRISTTSPPQNIIEWKDVDYLANLLESFSHLLNDKFNSSKRENIYRIEAKFNI